MTGDSEGVGESDEGAFEFRFEIRWRGGKMRKGKYCEREQMAPNPNLFLDKSSGWFKLISNYKFLFIISI